MLTKISILVSALLIYSNLIAQNYQAPLFSYDSLLNISYGSATNFSGENENLFFDLYKPKSDGNCKRPLIILIHGGAWVAGSKEDTDLVFMSRYFAKRGYVVANMNYRMGMHKPTNWSLYALCDPSLFSPCAYISDSAEVYRANYRAMQDTKGLIRFMKERSAIDSTDIDNVFVVGESAGGFIALQTALMTNESQKPINCNGISNAPTPDSDFSQYNCSSLVTNFERPDLGLVEGTLHLNGFDASVKGVGNFFGGILDISLLNSNSNSPFLYLYHQGSDIIVHYNYGKLLGRTSYECFAAVNLCQPYYFYPNAHGSKGIQNALTSIGNTNFIADIIENYEYQNDCFDNGHSIDFISTRLNTMNSNFANIISISGNNPSTNCETFVENEQQLAAPFPNPVQFILHLPASSERKLIFNSMGKLISESTEKDIDCCHLQPGLYIIQIGNRFFRFTKI